jgi:hypothetical protein
VKRAFTLVEMLVATAVATIAGAALAGALASMVAVERRATSESPVVMEPAFRALNRDLSAWVDYGEEPFVGSASTLRLTAAHRYFDPTIALMREDVTALTYRLREGVFVCEAEKTAATAKVVKSLVRTALIGGVRELTFSYGVFDPAAKTLRWQRSYRGNEPPDAVAVHWRRSGEMMTRYCTVYRDAPR